MFLTHSESAAPHAYWMAETSDDEMNVYGRLAGGQSGAVELIVFPSCGVCTSMRYTAHTGNTFDWASRSLCRHRDVSHIMSISMALIKIPKLNRFERVQCASEWDILFSLVSFFVVCQATKYDAKQAAKLTSIGTWIVSNTMHRNCRQCSVTIRKARTWIFMGAEHVQKRKKKWKKKTA